MDSRKQCNTENQQYRQKLPLPMFGLNLNTDTNTDNCLFNKLTRITALLHSYPVNTKEHHIEKEACCIQSGD